MNETIEPDADKGSGRRQADLIREYAYRTYVAPARAEKKSAVSIRAGDIVGALRIPQSAPNVCNALGGATFLDRAGLTLAGQSGPPQSTTTTFEYAIDPAASFGVGRAEDILRLHFAGPDVDTQYLVSFTLADGREIALQRDIARVQLWLEYDKASGPPPGQHRIYAAAEGRHSNLPGRLRTKPPASLGPGFPRSVASVRVETEPEMLALLDWYVGQASGLDRAELEKMREVFLARYPDFEPAGFAATSGGYFDEERRYKDALLGQARELLNAAATMSEEHLGGGLLDLLTSKESGLLGWRTDGRIKSLRAQSPETLERAAARLATSSLSPPEAVAEFVGATWGMLSEGQDRSLPYSESRNLPSMLLAFARPEDAIGINTTPMWKAGKRLLNRDLYANQPLTADEYANVLSLATALFAHMRDEWGWAPRDLWDVQGFLWAINRADPITDVETNEKSGSARAMTATNLILYGPPGTGKTYHTAARALELIDGAAPDGDHQAVKDRYDALLEAGQIRFVTFHQSYAYEDFVEGLRPTTRSEGEDGESQAGFRLEPRDGIFREISKLAEQALKTTTSGKSFDLAGRQFFKMSLGQAGKEDHIYDAAIEQGYLALGYGGEVDWSDPKYESYQAVFDRWNEIEPGTSGNSGNIAQLFNFRSSMKIGDLVVVSAGNSKFRAIGEVIGGYEFEPAPNLSYKHRRPVRWLLVLDDPLPIETIYDGALTMQSCYRLKEAKVKKEALVRLLPSEQPISGGQPDQFVLIVDEINRANVSKVFGELITLLEPDKRLGEKNELKVKLPYSGETFAVPANLHVIGTMNTADRSIALLDTALRRRFLFEELMPQPELLSKDVEGIDVAALLRTLNNRIEYLFDRDHQVGHAFFWDCETKEHLDSVLRNKIIPLLTEYFYEDWERVRQALGETQDEGGFIRRIKLAPPAGGDEFSGERFRYQVQDIFSRNAYLQLAA